MDQAETEPAHHRPHRRGQIVPGLCLFPHRLPGRVQRAVPEGCTPLCRLALTKGDGRYIKLLATFAKTDLLILDDYGLGPFTREQRYDFLEILEDRYGLRSTLVTSQLPVEHWHEHIGDPTTADAILDRLVHNAHTLKLKEGSMRKKTPLTEQQDSK
jgi:hypothetical protein